MVTWCLDVFKLIFFAIIQVTVLIENETRETLDYLQGVKGLNANNANLSLLVS
jgi:hypothetical protein